MIPSKLNSKTNSNLNDRIFFYFSNHFLLNKSLYYESDSQDTGVVYAMKNKTTTLVGVIYLMQIKINFKTLIIIFFFLFKRQIKVNKNKY